MLKSSHILTGDVTLETQKSGHSYLYQQGQSSHYNYRPSSTTIFISKGVTCSPNGHSHNIEVIQRVSEQQSKESLVISRSDAIVQKSAMMVKLFGTAVAAHAMMTILVHLAIANETLLYHR